MAIPMPMSAAGPGGASPAGASGAPGASQSQLPEFVRPYVPDFLATNPYFLAGFGVAGIGMVATLGRQSATQLQSIMQRQMLTSLEIPSKDYSYQWVMQWLVKNNAARSTRHLGVETQYTKNKGGKVSTSFELVPGIGRHFMWYGGYPIMVERNRETKAMDLSTGNPFETLTLTTFSVNSAGVFQKLLQQSRDAAVDREVGKTIIYQAAGPEWRQFGDPKTVRPFDSVLLDGKAGDEIAGDVDDFLASQGWYLDRGIPYRRGYLLYGPPGCGKTSYVMALAGKLQYNIAVMNVGDPSMSDDRLQHLLALAPPQTIILLEDIDWAIPRNPDAPGADTGVQSDPRYAGLNRVTFSGLLNALDGVVATEERIVFMTTNHIDRLPPALIRPGRVDLQVYVGLATPLQIHKMFLRFFPGEDVLAERFVQVLQNTPISMAELQGFFMFCKQDPKNTVEHARHLVSQRAQQIKDSGSDRQGPPANRDAA